MKPLQLMGMCAIVSLLGVSGAANSYDSADTDYTQLLTQIWTEDAANDIVDLVNTFSCIIANSRGDLPQHVNGTWRALIDEVDCDIGDHDNLVGKRYAETVLTSSRASDVTDQEIQAFFTATDGTRYIANLTLRKSEDALPPWGSWYFSFYKNREGASGPVLDFDPDGDNGFADIRQVGNDIVVDVADKYSEGSEYEQTLGHIVLTDGSVDSAKFVGTMAWDYGGGNSGNRAVAGIANSDFYYRAGIEDDGSVSPGTGLCLSRTDQWQNNWRSQLFYKNDGPDYQAGDRVVIDGGFGFRTSDGSEGYYGHWGLWMPDGLSFAPGDDSVLEITRRRDSEALSVQWAPGTIDLVEDVTVSLETGDAFEWYGVIGGTWGQYEIIWNDVLDGFTYDGNVVLDQSNPPWQHGMYSLANQTYVEWNGEIAANAKYSFSKGYRQDASSSINTASVTQLDCASTQCPIALITAGDWVDSAAQSSVLSDSPEENRYFYTGAQPAIAGIEPFTLYYDSDNNGLDVNDPAIRFEFKTTRDWETGAVAFETYGGGPSGAYTGDWPSISFNLEVADTGDTYRYSIGAYEWDHGYMLLDSEGAGVGIDQPIEFEYTFAAADDVNSAQTLAVDENALAQGAYNPYPNLLDGDFTPSDLAAETFLLRFNGDSLDGMPGVELSDGTSRIWVRLANLKNGTVLTGGDGTEYVIKTAEAGRYFLPAPGGSCSDIEFANLSEIGLSLSDVPDLTDVQTFPRPSQTWANKGTPDATACDVVHGEATCP